VLGFAASYRLGFLAGGREELRLMQAEVDTLEEIARSRGGEGEARILEVLEREHEAGGAWIRAIAEAPGGFHKRKAAEAETAWRSPTPTRARSSSERARGMKTIARQPRLATVDHRRRSGRVVGAVGRMVRSHEAARGRRRATIFTLADGEAKGPICRRCLAALRKEERACSTSACGCGRALDRLERTIARDLGDGPQVIAL